MRARVCIAIGGTAIVATFALLVRDASATMQPPKTEREIESIVANPLPAKGTHERALIDLGQKLYFDTRLSSNGAMSCETCHLMTPTAAGATPGIAKNKKVDGKDEASRNSPSIFNAAFSFRQRWVGDGGNLEEVITVPLTRLMNPPPKPLAKDPAVSAEQQKQLEDEHRLAEEQKIWTDVITRLRPHYAAEFRAVFPDKSDVDKAGLEKALAAYMEVLLPLDSEFDKFLDGKPNTLSADAKAGYDLFKDYGCVACHQGRGVGGNMVAPLGVIVRTETVAKKMKIDTHELLDDKKTELYKVPSLRNVKRTFPYFHNGKVTEIRDAVMFMGRVQLGRELDDASVDLLCAFLETLNGAPPAELLVNPHRVTTPPPPGQGGMP